MPVKEINREDFVSGIKVHSYPNDYILHKMKENITGNREPLHISITNTESMYYAEIVPQHRNFINTATFSLCDGIGSVIAAKFQGKEIKRFNGPDLLLEACSYGQEHGWRHFFYGGKEGVADLLAENLKKKFPEMKVAGTFCPPFRDLTQEEELSMMKLVNEANPDIIWVGLGLLKQEKWIANHKNRLNIPWAVGVGAAFDFYAGTVKRAPLIYRKTGFEWLYRLAKEPRMFKRNVNSYKFMYRAIKKGLVPKK